MQKAAAHAGRGPGFVSLIGGMGRLVSALVDTFPANALHLFAPAAHLARDRERFVVEVGSLTWRARALVLAVPAPRAAPLVAELIPAAEAPLSGIRFASTATVLLGFRREDVTHPLDGYGFVVPRSEGRRMSACTFVSTKLPGRAPVGHVLVRGFLGGIHDPAVLDGEDGALAKTALDEMTPVLGVRGAPVLTRVYRYPLATPQMEVGHAERLAAIERAAAEVPGLFLTGAGLRGTGLPDVIGDARRTADAVRLHLAAR
jgi:oxygen-dependent protoporphyrinogen oxidase